MLQMQMCALNKLWKSVLFQGQVLQFNSIMVLASCNDSTPVQLESV
jgi:hypothetical protein